MKKKKIDKRQIFAPSSEQLCWVAYMQVLDNVVHHAFFLRFLFSFLNILCIFKTFSASATCRTMWLAVFFIILRKRICSLFNMFCKYLQDDVDGCVFLDFCFHFELFYTFFFLKMKVLPARRCGRRCCQPACTDRTSIPDPPETSLDSQLFFVFFCQQGYKISN